MSDTNDTVRPNPNPGAAERFEWTPGDLDFGELPDEEGDDED